MSRGKFITLEGIDGAGKSTHVGGIADFLRGRGKDIVVTREPGGTPLGEKLRALVLSQTMDIDTEALLMFAARREHIAQLIAPARCGGTRKDERGPVGEVPAGSQEGCRGYSFDPMLKNDIWVAGTALEELDPPAAAAAPRDPATERRGPGRVRIRPGVRAIAAVRGSAAGRAALRRLPRLRLVFARQSPRLPADRAREHGARARRGGRGAREEEERADPHRAGTRARRLPRRGNASGGSARHPGLSRRSDEREHTERAAEKPGGASACHGFPSRHHAARAPARDGAKPLLEVCV